MDDMVALLAGWFAWFFRQPTAFQVIVGLGILVGLYPLLVVVRLIVAALYGAFRGLGQPWNREARWTTVRRRMHWSTKIRPAQQDDRAAVLAVEAAAFATPAEAELGAALLDDPTAQPIVSLLAEAGAKPIGHVLFTSAAVQGNGVILPASILAPLAVVPEAQRQGVGRALIDAGIDALKTLDIGLVFVLGHIEYYPRAGFRPALPLGLRAPYDIDPAVADAWMVRETRPDLLGTVQGTVRCADALMRPELWREQALGAASDGPIFRVDDRLVALPGCPPLPQAFAGTLGHWLTCRRLPRLAGARRPVAYYGQTVHDPCSRLHHYAARRFARSFLRPATA